MFFKSCGSEGEIVEIFYASKVKLNVLYEKQRFHIHIINLNSRHCKDSLIEDMK